MFTDQLGAERGTRGLPGLPRVGNRPLTLDALFTRMARARPAALAVQLGSGRLTYGAAETWATRLASLLVLDGVQLGDPVIVHCADLRQALVAQLAVLKAGGVCVPVSPRLDGSGLRRIAGISGAPLVLCGLANRTRWQSYRPVLVLDAAEIQDRLRLLRADPSLPRSDSMDAAHLLIAGEDPCSGQLVDHRAWQFSIAARRRQIGPAERVVVLSEEPLGAPALSGMWWTFASGGTLYGRADRRELVRWPVWAGRSTAVFSPEEYATVLDTLGRGTKSAGPGTVVLVGGPCPRDLPERHFAALPGTRLWAEFAPGGAMPWTSREISPRDAAEEALGIGTPVPNVQVQILGPDGAAVPTGRVGEVCAVGPALPFDSVHALGLEPWLTPTGSPLRSSWLGRRRPDGSLEVTERCPVPETVA
ncbi:AMP-binding protein [Kitasatospora sp. NPDC056531]|uniref:AMP-binding protein n=1 Tax=Kitasatospora sp. NPDC056531 TaxID=3345856 RepID=UPI00368CF9F5